MSPPVALPEGEEKREAVIQMFDRVAPSYERLNRIISLGQDRRWRARMLAALDLPRGARVLDVACGTGDLCRAVAASGGRPVGIDLSAGMLGHARTEAPLVRGDALRLPIADGAVDGLLCGFALRNFVGLDGFFDETARVVRPGGRIALLDAAEPTGRLSRVGHRLWFRGAVPRLGAALGGDRDAYRYLPASTAYLPAGDALVRAISAAGFADARRDTFMLGAVQLIAGTRDGA